MREEYPRKLTMLSRTTERCKKPPKTESTEAEKRFGEYCRFHENYGYNTNKCRHLRDFIEESIQEKKLQQYIREPQDGV